VVHSSLATNPANGPLLHDHTQVRFIVILVQADCYGRELITVFKISTRQIIPAIYPSDDNGKLFGDVLHIWLIDVGGIPAVVNEVLGSNGTGHLGRLRGNDMDLQQHATQHTCCDPISLFDELHR